MKFAGACNVTARPLHLAQRDIGRRIAPRHDPAAFLNAVDAVNGIGKRSPGFVWMMEGSGGPGTGNTQTERDGDAQAIGGLSVWDDSESLEAFVCNTGRRRFHARRGEWCALLGTQHRVMWWIAPGHRPALEEAGARLDHLNIHGDSEHAFGWAWRPEAQLWRSRNCTRAAG